MMLFGITYLNIFRQHSVAPSTRDKHTNPIDTLNLVLLPLIRLFIRPQTTLSMDNKGFPSSQGARLPVSGPLPARNQPTSGISSLAAGGARRKRGPAGRETTHPLTVNFPQRPEPKEQQSSPTTAG